MLPSPERTLLCEKIGFCPDEVEAKQHIGKILKSKYIIYLPARKDKIIIAPLIYRLSRKVKCGKICSSVGLTQSMFLFYSEKIALLQIPFFLFVYDFTEKL